jgi:hypothetical protein
MQPSTRTATLAHRRLPAPNAASRSGYTLDTRALVRRRFMSRQPASTTDAALWSRHVSALDRGLGQCVDSIHSLMRVQALILIRQDCARRAVEASAVGLGSADCPRYLVDPILSLRRCCGMEPDE